MCILFVYVMKGKYLVFNILYFQIVQTKAAPDAATGPPRVLFWSTTTPEHPHFLVIFLLDIKTADHLLFCLKILLSKTFYQKLSF